MGTQQQFPGILHTVAASSKCKHYAIAAGLSEIYVPTRAAGNSAVRFELVDQNYEAHFQATRNEFNSLYIPSGRKWPITGVWLGREAAVASLQWGRVQEGAVEGHHHEFRPSNNHLTRIGLRWVRSLATNASAVDLTGSNLHHLPHPNPDNRISLDIGAPWQCWRPTCHDLLCWVRLEHAKG